MLAAMKNDIGIVGAKLLHLDGTIQHIGVVFDTDGVPGHVGYGIKDDGTYDPAMRSDYYDAVTFACALIRRDVWDAVGGLDEAYHFNYEDIDFCLKAREKGYRCWVESAAVITHLENKSFDVRSNKANPLWPNLKIFRDKWLTTDRMAALTGQWVRKTSGRLRDDRLNVAFLPSSRNGGVPWWRMEQPAKKLAEQGLCNVQTLYGNEEDAKRISVMENARVVVFQGQTAEWVLNLMRIPGRPFAAVYDYDDHPLHISPFAQAYKHFGVREIRMEDQNGPFWLWRDGENGFDIKRNLSNRKRQMEIFHASDMLTTTTVPLVEFYRTLNDRVRMLPNCIDFSVFQTPLDLWERKPGPIRIGWHGGDNHYHDICSIADPLKAYVNSQDVKLVLYGAYYRGPFKGIDPNKVEEASWISVEAFPYKLATLGIDVAVIPLMDPAEPYMGFNHYKSDVKFLEYSALRVPTLVAAGRAAYSSCLDGVNSSTYSTDDEFTAKLDYLCRDADLRKRIASSAYDWVREYRDLDKRIGMWAQAYQDAADNPRRSDVVEAAESVPDEDLRTASSNAQPEAPAGHHGLRLVTEG
jgi:glycosyltransferase involved in cell wall biosynthesis